MSNVPPSLYRLSAVCPPWIEKLVAGARNRQYRLSSMWWSHEVKRDPVS
jgi:hypothetical protein